MFNGFPFIYLLYLYRCRLPFKSFLRWTHVVDFRCQGLPVPLQDVKWVLRLPWSSPERCALEFLDLLPSIFDFLRHAAVLRGQGKG